MPTNNAINLSAQGVAYYNGSGAFTAPTLSQFGVVVGAASNNIATLTTGTNGQLFVGSTGANPTFYTATSSDGSINFTTGPGTISFQGTQSTTTQLGSVTLATNAETIAGTSTIKVTTPDDIKAKLGTQTSNGIPFGGGNSAALSWTTGLTAGQVVIGSNSGPPAAATLSAGTGISITNGNNSITITATGGGVTWNNVTTATQTVVANNGYISNNAGSTVAYTMPATGVVGDVIRIIGGSNASTTAPWTIALGSGSQQFHFGSAAITTGTGVLSATNQYDGVELVCIVSGGSAEWVVVDSIGNISYT